MAALEGQLLVVGTGGKVGAESDVVVARNIHDVLNVADIIVDAGCSGRILVPAHRAINTGTDHAAALRHGLDDIVGLIALQIGKRACVRVRHEYRLRGDLDGLERGTAANM